MTALHEANREQVDGSGYMPQLDALRAFAVAAVLVHHLTADGWETGAVMGVRLFFVLSGFLITGILLRSRDSAEAQGSKHNSLRRFYARRFLRIFPLYYFVVVIGLVFNAESAREYAGWLITYTLNLKMAAQGWYIANFAHFWTLAVEEQFYVFWPWFVLFVPKKWLIPGTIAMVSVGPLYRLYHVIGWLFFGSQADSLRTYISTLACLDSLGAGSLLAIVAHRCQSREKVRRSLTFSALPLGLMVYVGTYLLDIHFGRWEFALVLSDLGLALIFCWLIFAASMGFGGPHRALLRAKPLTYFGKISYGIYVYHPFMPVLLPMSFAQIGWQYPDGEWTRFVLATLVTLAVSSLSWHLLEAPINRLKRHFGDAPTAAESSQHETASELVMAEGVH